MKKCSRCKKEKPLSDFHKRSDRPIGIQPHCKECQEARKDNYLSTEHGKRKAKEYTLRCYAEKKDEILLKNKLWRETNKERRKAYLRDYDLNRRQRDPLKMLGYKKNYLNKRYSNDFKYRLCRLISSGLHRSLGSQKNGYKWESLVDFTYDDLVSRLKKTIPKGYSWKDYVSRNTDLEIDHITPIAAFNFSSPEDIDFKRCWALSNLQLLPKVQNLRKKNNINCSFQPSLSLSVQ